jgi:carboxyl-terminal processing protease
VADNKHQIVAEQHTAQMRISRNTFFLTVVIVAVIGFVAGTRSNDLLGAIAPVLGLKVETSTVDLSSVERTYQQLKANFDGKLDTQKLIDGANQGLVAAAGDQYTIYMDAMAAKQFNNDLTGQIGGGIGAEISLRNDVPTIIQVLADNPAQKAGIEAGDVITAINGQSTNGWTADKAAEQVRGGVGTSIKLTLLRGTQAQNYTLTRETVNDPSVQSAVENGIGIMTISRFDDQTGSLAQTAAQSFKQQGVKSVILDLRDNGGGYLTAAQDVASLWLNDEVVVSERTNGTVVDELKSSDNAVLAGLPTVVLVNGNSASASEIVAGALQDHNVATLIGEKTFGKGTVQKVIDLGAGTQLKVTVARWYTPNGKNINKQGITPNQIVGLTATDVNAGKDPQLDAAKQHLGQ